MQGSFMSGWPFYLNKAYEQNFASFQEKDIFQFFQFWSAGRCVLRFTLTDRIYQWAETYSALPSKKIFVTEIIFDCHMTFGYDYFYN